ncbi:MAG TPA: Rieske (2Fe-2S) protein [Ktedonobacterales bacterium]
MTSDNRRPPDDGAIPDGDSAAELESAEQYMRAHELIERLRAERKPALDGDGEDDARLRATAAVLHAAAPGADQPDPIFAARLFARLEAEHAQPPIGQASSVPAPAASAASAPPDNAPDNAPDAARKRSGVSRRGLLWGGLGAAAAALTGAAVTAAIEQAGQPPAVPASALIPAGTGTWVAVAALSSLPQGAVARFEAGAVIGYLQHTANGFVALSGVCTHMACLLQWNRADRTFDCPCHGGRFLASGKPAPGAPYLYPPLPVIETKVEADKVWVYVTGDTTGQDVSPSGTATPSSRGYGRGG